MLYFDMLSLEEEIKVSSSSSINWKWAHLTNKGEQYFRLKWVKQAKISESSKSTAYPL